jgi:hypothetical protein
MRGGGSGLRGNEGMRVNLSKDISFTRITPGSLNVWLSSDQKITAYGNFRTSNTENPT